MSVLAKKLYFDIYNLENDLRNKEQTILEYQVLFEEYILNFREQNSDFATTYSEIDELNKKIVQREFDKTINDIEQTLKNTARAAANPEIISDNESIDDVTTSSTHSKQHLESIVKTYREIAKITHPDKTIQLEVSKQKEYDQYYKKATSFYDSNDLYSLLLISKMLGNNPFNIEFGDADIANLKDKKEKLEKDISEIQQTFIWNFMNIENEAELNDFISKHFKNMLNRMK